MLVKGIQARIFDTHKTIPGLRNAQKNMRSQSMVAKITAFGLSDKICIEENHIASAGSITQAIQAVRQMYPTK